MALFERIRQEMVYGAECADVFFALAALAAFGFCHDR
jgi:hypothetical protein